MLELIFWMLAGFGTGVFAGLIPGIHPNLFVALTLGLATSTGIDPLHLSIFLISAGVVNTFVNYIPAILLGAPEDDTAMSVLPGHRMLFQGRAYEAIKLTVIGGMGAALFSIVILPVFAIFIPALYESTRSVIHLVLIFVVSYLIFSENGKKKIIYSIFVFFLAGIFGLIALNAGDQMIFPLLSGLFGLPSLFISMRSKTSIPERFEFESERLAGKHVFSGILSGSLAGIIVGLLPGVGSAQATVLAQEASNEKNEEIGIRKFLIASGGVNTSDIIYSILAIYLIGNPRSGIAVAVSQLVSSTLSNTLIFIAVIFASACFGAYTTLKISRWAIFQIRKVDYPRLSFSIFALVWLLIGLLTGFFGLLVAAVAFSIGLFTNLSGVKRSHMMACLILPTILFFSGL